MRSTNAVKLVGALALASAMAANLALAGNPNPKVLPPNSTPYGMTYGEWGAAWWQWELLATVDANPATDTTGEFAYVNQSGPVFFLAGTFGGEANRTVTVRPGKAFFLPISNWVLTYPEDAPLGMTEEEAEAWMRDTLNAAFDGANPADLICEVDGVAVKDPLLYRAQSEAFRLYLPPDCASVTDWGTYQGRDLHYAAGWHYPNVSDGYWVMLAPLAAGQHTIHIKVGTYLDVTYDLTVAGGQ
jgi:hypothetical protein